MEKGINRIIILLLRYNNKSIVTVKYIKYYYDIVYCLGKML